MIVTILLVLQGLYSPLQDRAVRDSVEVPPRVRYTINEQWRYAPGALEGAQAPGYADSTWARVDLPHTWNADDAFDKVAGYRRGFGWYRKQLDLAPALRGKKLYLYFEGANQVADVYVNGRHAGQHVGGYTAFVFDVTDLVTFDAPNVVAVRVDNRHDVDIPPLDADFTFYGGIYRDVWLLATEPVHVEVLNHASSGVFIDTPEVSAEEATVRVRGGIVNDGDAAERVRVEHRVVDAQGRTASVLVSEFDVAPGGLEVFEQESDPLPNPHLWSPDDPYLYRVVTEVRAGRRVLDRVDNPLGFRWFAVDGDGLTLNGAPIALYGTNRHQDYPRYGNAVPDWAHRKDLRIIEDMGFNFLRLAHYPQDPVVLQEADRLGLLLWEEVPVVNTITMNETFARHAEQMLVDMIRQHYNHPSVVMWGYMNEILLREPKPLPEGYREAVAALARRLEARVRAEDPSRLTVTAQSSGEVYNGVGISDIPDILGMNLYFGWYYDELETLGAFLDSLHRAHPERPLLVSEYGAGSDERVHTLTGRAFDFSSEYQQTFHRSDFRQIQERPYMVGSAIWNQFDFGSATRQDTKNSINQKGIFFFDREPKDIAYYYKAKLRDDVPVLHIAREWHERAGSRPEDRTQPLWVYTNLDEVELFANGASLGTQAVENATARWSVPFVHGANRIEARGTRGGEAVEDAVTIHFTDRTPFFTDKTSATSLMAVNAGAHYQYVDDGATVWEADQAYEEGGWGHAGGEASRTHHRILGTLDDPLYQAVHEGADAYRFDVPDGVYEVTLGFVETRHDAAGARVFDVSVNAVPVFTNLDLAGTYGRYTAVDRTVEARAADGRGLTVRFTPHAGRPTVSAILVRRLP